LFADLKFAVLFSSLYRLLGPPFLLLSFPSEVSSPHPPCKTKFFFFSACLTYFLPFPPFDYPFLPKPFPPLFASEIYSPTGLSNRAFFFRTAVLSFVMLFHFVSLLLFPFCCGLHTFPSPAFFLIVEHWWRFVLPLDGPLPVVSVSRCYSFRPVVGGRGSYFVNGEDAAFSLGSFFFWVVCFFCFWDGSPFSFGGCPPPHPPSLPFFIPFCQTTSVLFRFNLADCCSPLPPSGTPTFGCADSFPSYKASLDGW